MASAQYLDFGVPFPPYPGSSSGAFETFALDASGDRIAWTFMPAEAHVITELAVPVGSRTGTPPTYRISLQGVDLSTGNPDGTVLGGGSPASATFTPPADTTWNNTIQWITLSNSFTVSRGTMYAIVIDYSSGTVDASNFTTINNGHTNIGARSGNVIAQQYTGTWSKRNIAPVWGFRTSTQTFGSPIKSFFTTAFSSDTASGSGGDERGMKFTLPAGWGATFKVRGIRWIGNMSAAAKTITATLYTGTTALQDVTIDSDTAQGTGNYMTYTAMFDESSLTALDFGSAYYVAVKPNETASNLGIYGLELAAAQDRECFGLNSLWAFRTDAGAWDETVTTRAPLMWLILDDITEPAAGGGGTVGHGLTRSLLVGR
jgi:hypothetical protein